jgi:flavodoxin
MKRCLVVYYSRSGRTAKVATAIANGCHADLEQIYYASGNDYRPGVPRALWQALADSRPAIAAPRRDPAEYELVVLGTPVWAGRMAAPLRSYIAAQRGSLRRVAAFCTQGGNGGPEVLAAIGALSGRRLLATLTLDGEQFERSAYIDPARAFGRRIEFIIGQTSGAPA